MQHRHNKINIQADKLDAHLIKEIDEIRKEMKKLIGCNISRKAMVEIAIKVLRDKTNINGATFFIEKGFMQRLML